MQKHPSNSSLHGQLTNEIQNGVEPSQRGSLKALETLNRRLPRFNVSTERSGSTSSTISYAYDHRGRMVSKRITQNDGSDTLVKSVSYLWDGWNIIRETATDGNGTTVSDNVWGLDIDGTLQGADGVGGLLAVVRDGETYLPTYDANGNISEYVSTNGEIVAHYDYSPFGETLIESGDLASTFTHRFSTKPWCSVTGLYEYQMRKYRPGIGRWLSRDPIGEGGGLVLYQYANNNANLMIDNLGQAPRYVYPGVILVHDPVSGKNQIIQSPDWDWGDYDSEFGGKTARPVKDSPSPSTFGPTVTVLMVTHEFLFYKGCVYYCISWTPLDLLGVGFETSLRKQVSPLTVIVGLGRNLGVGSSGTTIDAAVGVGLSIPSPVHPSLRLLCIALTEKSEDGCPCKELKPASIGEYAE